jgi:Tol biopolymer transport system component
LNVVTGQITNLTKSPAIWDEHGVFSPDGQKIVFMSSYPYRAYSWASTTMFLKAEYMIMNKDGSNLKQVTHYNQWGYPEFSWSGGIAANANWNPSGAVLSARQLLFPNYKDWDISFAGNCGGQPF